MTGWAAASRCPYLEQLALPVAGWTFSDLEHKDLARRRNDQSTGTPVPERFPEYFFIVVIVQSSTARLSDA
jgi:hypothetical protein